MQLASYLAAFTTSGLDISPARENYFSSRPKTEGTSTACVLPSLSAPEVELAAAAARQNLVMGSLQFVDHTQVTDLNWPLYFKLNNK